MPRAKAPKNQFRIKRVYDPPTLSDGQRILVDRLWPRGISKDKAKIDLWLKDIAPSHALRQKFHGNPDLWDEFRKAYGRELTASGCAEAVTQIRALAKKQVVTLLYAAKNDERNNAMALKLWLDGNDLKKDT